MDLMKLIPGLVIGVLWLAGCIILIKKIKIRQQRTPMYVISIILFVLCTGIFCGIWAGSAIGKEILRDNVVLLDNYLKENHGNVQLVRSGIDVSNVPQAIDELRALVPNTISELGLSGLITEGIYKKALDKAFGIIRSKTDLIVSFAGEDGKVTSTTIITALEWEINATIDRIVFKIHVTMAIILTLVLVICIFLATRKPRETVVYGKTEQ